MAELREARPAEKGSKVRIGFTGWHLRGEPLLGLRLDGLDECSARVTAQ